MAKLELRGGGESSTWPIGRAQPAVAPDDAGAGALWLFATAARVATRIELQAVFSEHYSRVC